MTDYQAKIVTITRLMTPFRSQFISAYHCLVEGGYIPYIAYTDEEGYQRFAYFRSQDALICSDVFIKVRKKYPDANLSRLFDFKDD